MRFLILLLVFTLSLKAAPLDLSGVSASDIIKTVEHMHEINEDLEQQLQHAKNAHEDALQDIIGKQAEVNTVTKSRNDEAAAKDTALGERDTARRDLSVVTKHVWNLKIQRSGIAYLLVMMGCIMFGLAKEGWAGILAAFVLIPSAVSAAILMLP